jgi:hypothetical protein
VDDVLVVGVRIERHAPLVDQLIQDVSGRAAASLWVRIIGEDVCLQGFLDAIVLLAAIAGHRLNYDI